MPTKFDTVKFLEQSQRFSDTTVAECMENNASLIAYYGSKAVEWDRVVNDLKLDLKVQKAQLSVEIKKSGEKTTVDSLAHMVQADPETVLIERKLNIAIEQADAYNMAVTTFQSKGHMLTGRNNSIRTELSNTSSAMNPTQEGRRITSEEGRAVMERIASKA